MIVGDPLLPRYAGSTEEVVPARVWLIGKLTSRWVSEDGVQHLLDGFMLDGGMHPVASSGVPDPSVEGYGNFAYLRLNAKSSTLEVYADACESRNVFYWNKNDVWILSNDMPLLLELAGERVVDEQSLFGYLECGYLNINRRTLFRGVSKLKACERLELRFGGDTVRMGLNQYWRPQINVFRLSREEAVETVEANLAGFLKAAVSLMQRPLTTLTCGTDSNLFYYLLEKYVGRLRSLTHAFDHPAYDEYRLLEQLRLLTAENMKIVSYDDVMAFLSDAIGAIGMPINGLASMGEFKVYRQAANLGADALITGAGDYIWVSATQAKIDEILAADCQMHAGDGTVLARTDYFTDDFRSAHTALDIPFYSLGIATTSRLKQHLLDQVFVKRTPHIAFDHSALGNAFGLECLQPFVERKTIEFCLGLADDCLFFNDQPKSLLVTLLARFNASPFPRLKMNTPQRELIRGLFRPAIEDLIMGSRLASAGYLDSAKLLKLFRHYLDQPELGNSYFVWKFIVTEIWYRLFIGGEKADLVPSYPVRRVPIS